MKFQIEIVNETLNTKYVYDVEIPDELITKKVVAIEEGAPECVNIMSTTESSCNECVEYVKLVDGRIVKMTTRVAKYWGGIAKNYNSVVEADIVVDANADAEEAKWIDVESNTLLEYILVQAINFDLMLDILYNY